MIINLKSLSENIIENSSGNEVKMRLSENASSMVFQLFTKNVYSNPIGTVVREITSNCFDSHVEAGIDAPVVIRKSNDKQTNTNYISFIDYGVGMNPDRMNNVYGVYFESTKRADNKQIGGFGIGAKSVLAYKRSTGMGEGEYDNSFYVITTYNKTKYYYCIYEGSESPVISLVHSESTTDGNGTEIRVPVLEKDVATFEREMIRQLYYFENIVFEGFETEDYNGDMISQVPNDYQIVRADTFLFRGKEYSDYIHICLGRVAYPIDYSVLGLSQYDYKLPIAIKLDVGDLNVTVSRESIDYGENEIKLLKGKLLEVRAEVLKLINKQYENIVSLEDYFKVTTKFGVLNFPNGTSMSVTNLIKLSDVDFSNFEYSFTKMPTDKQLFSFFFDVQAFGKVPNKSRYEKNKGLIGSYETLTSNNNILYIDDEFKRKNIKQAWLNESFDRYYIIKKRVIVKDSIRSEVAELFNINIDRIANDNNVLVPYMRTLLIMQEEYMSIVRKYLINYDELEVPEEFILSRKRGSGVSENTRKLTIPIKFVGGYAKERVRLSILFDYDKPIFYGTVEDEYKLMDAQNLFKLLFDNNATICTADSYNNKLSVGGNFNGSNKSSIAFIQIAVANVKHMKHCKNAMHIDKFFSGMLRRKVDNIQLFLQNKSLIEKYNRLDDFYTDGYINKVSVKWGNRIDKIKSHIESIPKSIKNDSLDRYESKLIGYLNLGDIKQTKEQQRLTKSMDDMIGLDNANSEILNYFNLPYSAQRLDDKLIKILKSAMVL